VLLHALAFIIWDIGTRPPARLLADIRGAASSLRALARALWQFVLGLAILCAGAMLMLSVTVVDVRRDFAVLEGIAVLAGLAIEMLLGPSLRRHLARR
jgi:hypothetical protein